MQIVEVKLYSLTQPKLCRFDEYRQTPKRGLEIQVPCTKELIGRLEIKLMTGDLKKNICRWPLLTNSTT